MDHKRRRTSSSTYMMMMKKKMMVQTAGSFGKMMLMKVSSSCSSRGRRSSSIIDYTKYLLDDTWFEIFRRLPWESIFKYRCVSKLWLSRLSNPSFVTMWMKFHNWTLVFRTGSLEDNHLDMPMYSTASVDLHSKFISNHDGDSFRFLHDKKFLLASSNGLVLCSTSLYKHKRYYVCNPLTERWISLPPSSQKYSNRSVLNGFICESSHITSKSTYKVIRIPKCNKKRTTIFDVEIFSSDVGEWNTYEVSCPGEVTWQCPLFSNVVSHNGVVYWIGGESRIIAYDLNNKTACSFIKLPKVNGRFDTFRSRCLGVSKGAICYAEINVRKKTLSVWVLKEDHNDGGWVWDLVQGNIELKDMFAEMHSLLINQELDADKLFRLLAFNPVDRNVVFFRCDIYIWAFNIKTRTYDVLHSSSTPNCGFFQSRHEVLPFVLMPKPTILPPPSWSDS